MTKTLDVSAKIINMMADECKDFDFVDCLTVVENVRIHLLFQHAERHDYDEMGEFLESFRMSEKEKNKFVESGIIKIFEEKNNVNGS